LGSTQEQRLTAQRLLKRWTHDPCLFAKEALGVELWDRQQEALGALASNDFVSVRSGHKVGKSRMDATAALWWVCTRPSARVVFTAPAGHQVDSILWPELRKLYEMAARRGCPLGGRLYDDYHKGLRFRDGREIFGLTTRDAEAFAGISSPSLFFVVDEASGFPEKIFDSVFGNSTGGGKVLLTGNPTRISGTFFDTFHSKRGAWKGLRISSRETPNFKPGAKRIPGLASPEGVAKLEAHFGKGSPVLSVRVEGEFPTSGDRTVVSLALIEDAVLRWTENADKALPSEPLVVGLDCGRFGDDPTVAIARRGHRVVAVFDNLPKADGPDTAGLILKRLREHKLNGSPLLGPTEKPKIHVDVIGIGAAVFDSLKRSRDCDAVAVNVSNASDVKPSDGFPGYHNLRTQVHFAAADWLGAGGEIPPHEQLQADLTVPEYSFDSNGRFQVEEKDQIKRRLGRSPNHGDALTLTFGGGSAYLARLRAAVSRQIPG